MALLNAPSIKKTIDDFISDDDGNITRNFVMLNSEKKLLLISPIGVVILLVWILIILGTEKVQKRFGVWTWSLRLEGSLLTMKTKKEV